MSDLKSIEEEEKKDLIALAELEGMDDLQEFLLDFSAENMANITSKVDALIEEQKTFQDLFDISDEIMGVYYDCARDVLTEEKYEDSGNAFLFLTMMNPYVYDYWIGLGLSEHNLEHYERALKAYSMAALTNMDHPAPHFFAAQCYISQEKRDEAKESLELAMEYSSKEHDFQNFYKQAKNLKESIK